MENVVNIMDLPETLDGPMDSAWPMYCHDTRHTGRSPYSTVDNTGIELWRYKTSSIPMGDVVIDDSGAIYVGANGLYAINPNGTLKWKYGGAGTPSNPSIGPDGTIYAGYLDDLVALNPDGTLKWVFNMGTDRFLLASAPAISADGTIYIGIHLGEPGYSDGGEIIAVNFDGTERWRKMIANEWVDSSPCIGPDGTVYIGSSNAGRGYLHAFGPVDSNSPPETPTISGKANGKIGEDIEYMFRTIDPDNNPISYYVEWGDGKIKNYGTECASNEKHYIYHTYTEEGSFTIRAKAKDTLDEESDWGQFDVTITKKSKTMSSSLLLKFLERFPLLNLLLQRLRI